MLFNIMKEKPEIATMKERFNPKRKVPCRHGLCCYEVECGFIHAYNPDVRRLLRKEFNKQLKVKNTKEKIQSEIAKLGSEGFGKKWGDY